MAPLATFLGLANFVAKMNRQEFLMPRQTVPFVDLLDANQHRMAWFGVVASLVLACVGGACQQFLLKFSKTMEFDMRPSGFWREIDLGLIAGLYLAYAIAVGVLLLYRHRRESAAATLLLTMAAIAFFGGAALAHFGMTMRALAPLQISG